VPSVLWAQYQFDFESGSIFDWEQVPSGRWEVTSEEVIAGVYSLHHGYDSPLAGKDFILLRHEPPGEHDSLSLAFRVRHGYPPSAYNHWQVAWLAETGGGDRQDGTGSIHLTGGLVVGVNLDCSDDLVKIWRCNDGVYEVLCTTSVNYQEQVGTAEAPCFRMVWQREGELQLFITADPESEPLELIGTCDPGTFRAGRYLVIGYGYSAGQDRKFWLDDIRLEGNFVADTLPPEITDIRIQDAHTILLGLSEPVSHPKPGSFLISWEGAGSLLPEEVTVAPAAFSGTPGMHAPIRIVLRFNGELPNRRELILQVRDLCDLDGNCLSNTFTGLMRNDAVWGDVVINEVMCDPEPRVLLPGCEYLEIYHRSRFPLDLEGWRVEVNGRSYGISGLKLGPGEYGVLAGPGGEELQAGRSVTLFASSSALPNAGAEVALYDHHGTLIHVVRYADPGTGPGWKQEGGWSLEATDPDRVCNTSHRWEYSEDRRGGTPGEKNSKFIPAADTEPPRFMYMGYPGSGSITLHFSELIRFDQDQMNRACLLPSGVRPDSMTTGQPFFDHLMLHFPGELPQGTDASLLLPSVSDCSGNLSPALKIPVRQVSGPRFSSVQVNEVMYDPADGCPEFIELHHPGDRFHELEDILLDTGEGEEFMMHAVPLAEESRILAPGDYVVLSRHTGKLMQCYGLERSGKWIEIRDMPSLPNSGGTIRLADRSGNVLEMVHYQDGMHMDLMDDTRGVSLERISPARLGTDPGNWHSAASIAGYSTPGRKNSQSLRDGGGGAGLAVEPGVFSPDQDGYEDFLQISVVLEGQGWVIRLWVTDLKGRPVRQLANNHAAGPHSTYTWDGEQDDGSMCPEGIYVVHLRGYHPVSGERFNGKRAAGLIYR